MTRKEFENLKIGDKVKSVNTYVGTIFLNNKSYVIKEIHYDYAGEKFLLMDGEDVKGLTVPYWYAEKYFICTKKRRKLL